MATAQPAKAPTAPTVKTAKTLARAFNKQPYLLSGDVPRNEQNEIEWDKVDFSDPDLFVVLASGMKGSHMFDYINLYNEEFDTTVNKIMWYFVLVAEYKKASEENREPLYKEERDEYRRLITPYGKWRTSSLLAEILELGSFLLSRHGRITGVDEHGRWIVEPVSQAEVLDAIDYDALMRASGQTDVEAQEAIFFELLTVSNLIDLEEARSRMENANKSGEDEGNSPESSGENG